MKLRIGGEPVKVMLCP